MNLKKKWVRFFSGFFIIIIWVIIISILLFIFWIFMIVDCAQREFKNPNDKVLWILIIVLVHWIGAIIYYFVVKRQDKFK